MIVRDFLICLLQMYLLEDLEKNMCTGIVNL